MATSVRQLVRGRRRSRRLERAYARFQAEVEPVLTSRPRVHRFAEPPLVGDERSPAEPIAVCIDPAGGGDAAATRASLERQTVRPAEVVEGPPGQARRATRARLIALVDAGDRLAPLALERLGQAMSLAPDARAVTCDEDLLEPRTGARVRPSVRPGPSPDLLLATDLVGGLLCVRPEEAEVGSRYEAALRLGGPNGDGLAHVPMILCHRSGPTPPDDSGADAAREVLAAWEPGAGLERLRGARRRVRRPLAGEPAVEAVVPFRDQPALLRRCAHSVLDRSSYERLGLRLVDNGSSEPETAALIDALAAHQRVTLTRDPRPFNFSALNNAAAASSSADFLIFRNSDTEVLTATWIEELLEEASRPEVGVVAPLLLHGDGAVQHAGAALGLHGYAGHPFAGLAPESATPFGAATDGTRN